MKTSKPGQPHSANSIGCRQTEVGPIPQDWELKPLGDLFTFSGGYSASRAQLSDEGHCYLHYGDIHGSTRTFVDACDDHQRIPKLDIPLGHVSPKSVLKDGDVVFVDASEDAEGASKHVVVVNRNDVPFISGLHTIVAKSKTDDVTHNYRHYCFQARAITLQFLRYAVGTKVTGISKANIRKLLLPLPRLNEQNLIAEALSDVDGLIESLEKLIAKKRSVKQAAMQQLLTGRTRLPGFTGKWETKRLGNISTCLPTANNPRADLSEYGEVEYIHYGDIHAHAQPVMDCSRAALPRINRDRIGSAVELQDGDLVLVDASEDLVGVGKSVEVRGLQGRNVVAGLHTILCRGSAEHWALGFKAYLQFIPAFKAALTRVATGISVYAVSKKQLADVELPLPPVPEQEAIVDVLADMDAEIEALERRREKTRQIKQGMMQQLLTGRLRLVTPEAQAPAAQADSDGKTSKAHSWAFNEAVVISTLAKHFGKEDFPLGRKRYTKLSYLLHRHAEQQVEGYLKKAAGPYNPKTKYGGPERIALEIGYIREHKNGPYTGFVAADNIAQAEGYFEKWYGTDAIQWLNQFRFKKNDDLELLATVDMAAEELRAEDQAVDVDAVKAVIRSHPEWKAKLDRAVFSNANIAKAIEASCNLFATEQDNIPGGT